MKKLLCFIAAFMLISFCQQAKAQENEDHFDFQLEMLKPNADYYDIVKRGNEFYAAHPDDGEDGGSRNEHCHFKPSHSYFVWVFTSVPVKADNLLKAYMIN